MIIVLVLDNSNISYNNDRKEQKGFVGSAAIMYFQYYVKAIFNYCDINHK